MMLNSLARVQMVFHQLWIDFLCGFTPINYVELPLSVSICIFLVSLILCSTFFCSHNINTVATVTFVKNLGVYILTILINTSITFIQLPLCENIFSLLTAFVSLVRPKLEYNSLV